MPDANPLPDFRSAPRLFLTELFHAAIQAADPVAGMRAHLPAPPKGRTIVLGAGKAASEMAAGFEALWPAPLEGLVVARHGQAVPVAACRRIRVATAAHPVPDAHGLCAADEMLRLAATAGPDDLVVALISGGGSALLPAPAEGLDLDDEIAVNRALLESGAPISAMNAVRKHVSRIKGGRLARAARRAGRLVSFVVSDVPGDDPAQVASGPTIPDRATRADALGIIARYRLDLPGRVMEHLESERDSGRDPCPLPDDADFARNEVHLVASAELSLQASLAKARQLGVRGAILADDIEGEAAEIGRMHAAIANRVARKAEPFPRPMVLLSGGETTVSIRDGVFGRGGRNSEFLLSFAIGIAGNDRIHALAADTDGIDGSEDNAGAFADGETVPLLRAQGHDPLRLLARHDSWSAFKAAGGLFSPGPTGTNVNDFRAILIR